MKKLVLAMLSLFTATGLVLAAAVVVVKFDADKKEITVKEGDDEKTYKITDKTTFKSGEKEVKSEFALKLLSNPKAAGKLKVEITAEKDTATEIKLPERKKKNVDKSDKN